MLTWKQYNMGKVQFNEHTWFMREDMYSRRYAAWCRRSMRCRCRSPYARRPFTASTTGRIFANLSVRKTRKKEFISACATKLWRAFVFQSFKCPTIFEISSSVISTTYSSSRDTIERINEGFAGDSEALLADNTPETSSLVPSSLVSSSIEVNMPNVLLAAPSSIAAFNA